MNKLLLAFTISMVIASCKSPEVSDPVEIKYEVLTEYGNWYGEYIDETGERICFCKPPLPDSGWTYTFTVSSMPFDAHIDATYDCPGCGDTTSIPDVTTNIYADNILVAHNTSNWAPGVASSDYTVK